MSEKMASYDFEAHGEKNPVDKHLILQNFADNTVATLKRIQEVHAKTHAAMLKDSPEAAVALAMSEIDEAAMWIIQGNIPVHDALLQEYISDEHYTEKKDRALFTILKNAGYTQEQIAACIKMPTPYPDPLDDARKLELLNSIFEDEIK